MKSTSIWNYVVEDFLEMMCCMAPHQHAELIEELGTEMRGDPPIDQHPAFSIGNKMVVCLEEPAIDECWFYDGPKGAVKKYTLTPSIKNTISV